MKIAILSMFLLAGAAAAADTENVEDALIQDLVGADSEDLDADASRRRRRGCCSHRHKPHRHRPHHHNPHGHNPHGHRPHHHHPHGHNPHGHRPHFHSPHGHTDCFNAGTIKHKIKVERGKADQNDKHAKDWQNEYNRLSQEAAAKSNQASWGVGAGLLQVEVQAQSGDDAPVYYTPEYDEDGNIVTADENTFDYSSDASMTPEEKQQYADRMDHCKVMNEHYQAKSDENKEEVKKLKERYQKNDCKELNNAFNSAVDFIGKIIQAIIEFLDSFKCTILTIAFTIAGAALDILLAGVPSIGTMLLTMKQKWYCAPDSDKKAKKQDAACGWSCQIKGDSPAGTLFNLLKSLVFPPAAGPKDKKMVKKLSPLAVFKIMYSLLLIIVGVIDDKTLNDMVQAGDMILFWVIKVWECMCGNFMTAICGICKEILFCNVPQLESCGCRPEFNFTPDGPYYN